MRLFRALEKDKPEEQLVYYQVRVVVYSHQSCVHSALQPGIGTYNKRQLLTKSLSYITTAIDQAFALNHDDHVKEGYVFV